MLQCTSHNLKLWDRYRGNIKSWFTFKRKRKTAVIKPKKTQDMEWENNDFKGAI
jgi:hypothetical protein